MTHIITPIRLRLEGCQRCGDKAERYTMRSSDNGLFRFSVCLPCAEILDRKDEQKRRQHKASATPPRVASR